MFVQQIRRNGGVGIRWRQVQRETDKVCGSFGRWGSRLVLRWQDRRRGKSPPTSDAERKNVMSNLKLVN